MREFIDAEMERLDVGNLTQFAKLIDVQRETLSRWYNTAQLPTPATARKVAAKLGISPESVPQFDPRGVGRPDALRARRLEEEVADLHARVAELAEALREIQEHLEPAYTDGRSRESRRPPRASSTT